LESRIFDRISSDLTSEIDEFTKRRKTRRLAVPPVFKKFEIIFFALNLVAYPVPIG
jgi:hypothetical protein